MLRVLPQTLKNVRLLTVCNKHLTTEPLRHLDTRLMVATGARNVHKDTKISRCFFKWGGPSIKRPDESDLNKLAEQYTYRQLRTDFASKISSMDGYFVDVKKQTGEFTLSVDGCLAIVWQSAVLATQKNNLIAVGTTEYRLNFIDKDMNQYEDAFLLSLEAFEQLLEQSNHVICEHYKVDPEIFNKSFKQHYQSDKKFASLVDLFMQNSNAEKPDTIPNTLTDEQYLKMFRCLCVYLGELQHVSEPQISRAFKVCYSSDKYFKEYGVHVG